MAATSTVFRNIRIGVEAVPGTAVAAPVAIPALEITLSTAGGEGEVFRPSGGKHPLFVTPGGDEHSTIALGGKACYNTLPYILAAMNFAAPTEVTTGVYKWECIPSSNLSDTYKTYTIEEGSGTATGSEVPYALFTGWGLDFKRQQITLSGSGFAGKVTDAAVLTDVTTTVTPIPIQGDDVLVYLADSQAVLDTTTALTDVANVEIHYNEKYSPWWGLDSSKPSFADVVELAPDAGGKIMVLHNTAGLGYRTAMRAGTTKWLRIKAVGPVITGTYTDGLQIDTPIQFTNPGDREDDDGAYALGFNFVCIHDDTVDGTNPGAMYVVVTNSVAVLS